MQKEEHEFGRREQPGCLKSVEYPVKFAAMFPDPVSAWRNKTAVYFRSWEFSSIYAGADKPVAAPRSVFFYCLFLVCFPVNTK